ncbi:hypothetical protein P5673_015875 [Acropora cervicornis]|uniref:Diacylglycerol kinase n=1 Tax=Acropora cervicornis TaxID=6130 RepID=A0AAD9QHG9_ACRCE|nr:hypothetical protein P5673_015875 [Acropora cervicornis]
MQIDGEPWMQPPAEVRDTSGLSCSKGGEQLDNSICFVSIHPLDSSIHPLSNWALIFITHKNQVPMLQGPPPVKSSFFFFKRPVRDPELESEI